MKRPHATVYAALLTATTLLWSATVSVGPAQARVESNPTGVSTVLQPQTGGLVSNCLVEGGQTVLLGALDAGKSVTITLTLESAEARDCQLAVSGQSEYLTVTMAQVLVQSEETQTMEEEALPTVGPLDLTMDAGSAVEVSVTFTASEQLTQRTTERVVLNCGNLWGTFLLELVPVADETKPAEPTESEETTEETESEETTEDTEPEETTEAPKPVTELPEPSLPVIDPTEPTVAQPYENTGDSANTGDGDAVEEDSQVAETVTPVEITLTAPAEFTLDRLLPVKLTVTGTPESVTIGDLPALTRYSTDGGEKWFQLYYGGAIELTPAESQFLLLDFSRTGIGGTDLTLTVSADEVQAGSIDVTAYAPVPQPGAVPVLRLPTEEERVALNTYLNPPTTEPVESQPAAQTEEETTQPTETTETTQTDEPDSTEPLPFELQMLPESGMFENDYFVLPLPTGWVQPTFVLERLERVDGNRAYTAIDDQSVTLYQTADGLVITPGTTPPKAGTYRLTIQHMFEGICAEQMQMTFFINDSTRSDVQEEEVPNNE